MYAHQVIEDLKHRLEDLIKFKYRLDPEKIEKWIDRYQSSITLLLNAQHFYFGQYLNIDGLITGESRKENFFHDSMSAVKNPYKITTFQFEFDSFRIVGSDDGNLLKKLLVIVEDIDDVFHIRQITQFKNEMFSVSDFDLMVSPNSGWYEYGLVHEDKDLIKKYYSNFNNFNITLSCANLPLLLLSCKNITTEQHDPPAKLNKARMKRGKQPLFTYHTLVLKPVGKKQESIPKHLWNNRIHLQRGHFKTYTEDAPLFGHITGRFWWQPHVRGQNRDGVVMKDYEVKTA